MQATTVRATLIAALLAVSTTSAAADAGGDARDALNDYANQLAPLQSRLSKGIDTHYSPEGCRRVIDAARTAGVPATLELRSLTFEKVPGARRDGGDYVITMRQSHAVCDEYTRWRRLADAHALFEEAQRSLDWLSQIDKSTNSAANGTKLAAVAERCTTGIDQIVAAGVPMDQVLEVHGRMTTVNVSIRTGKRELCDAVGAAAKTFVAEVTTAKASVEAERQQRFDQIAAPYKKAGFTGDRLQFMIDAHGGGIYGIGGAELTTAKARKASVLFMTLEYQGIYTVYRSTFRGDKLVSTTSQEFILRPGRAAYR
jgi:hypothetical protein